MSEGSLDGVSIRIAIGKAFKLGKCTNRVETWKMFKQRFAKAHVSAEKFAEYKGLKDPKRKNDLKQLNGWYLGAPTKDGSRKTESVDDRDIFTIDMDNLSVDEFESIKNGTHILSQYESVWHTTRSHTPEEPRVRFVLLADRPIQKDEFGPATRIIAHMIDPSMETVDRVSWTPAQLMYFPVKSKDQEYERGSNKTGKRISVDEVLESWTPGWKDFGALPRAPGEEDERERALRADDPWEKKGIIGAFCRAYTIEEAMDEFIPGVYGNPDQESREIRYSYMAGHGAFGAIVYDDGRFLYSHHGSDPLCYQNVNAFDMVRIHKFGNKDLNTDQDTFVTDLPSYKAMVKMAEGLKPVKSELVRAELDLEAMFDDIPEPEDDDKPAVEVDDDDVEDLLGTINPQLRDLPPYPGMSKALPREEKWESNLDVSIQGKILITTSNLVKILLNEPRFRGLMAINAFTGEMVATRSLKSKQRIVTDLPLNDPINGDNWSKFHDASIKTILSLPRGTGEVGYGMQVPDSILHEALEVAARHFLFHPVIEKLVSLPEWDGEERIERLWIDYFGCPDTDYHRETAKLMMTAAVARLFYPGLAFDHVPILMGGEDKRKSTFVKDIAYEIWGHDLEADFNNMQLAVEQMRGNWFLEMGELVNVKRADAQAQKSFISRREDTVRLAYDRRAQDFKRQCIFIGTTNEHEFLRDDQNRRWWPIKMRIQGHIDNERLKANLDQLWSEALELYRQALAAAGGRKDRIYFRLSQKAKDEAKALQNSVRMNTPEDTEVNAFEDWLKMRVPLSTALHGDDFDNLDDAMGDPMVVRTRTCAEQLVEECLGESWPAGDAPRRGKSASIGKLLRKVPGWVSYEEWAIDKGSKTDKLSIPGYGRPRAYVLEDATEEEIERGYRIVGTEDEPEDLL